MTVSLRDRLVDDDDDDDDDDDGGVVCVQCLLSSLV